LANLALWLAARFIPARAGIRELQAVQAMLISDVASTLLRSDPEHGAALLREAFSNFGRTMGETLKMRFRVRPTLSDLAAAWRTVCNLAGVRYKISREADRVVFAHPACPLWEEFSRRRLNCSEACIPMITALSQVIAPQAQVELLRPPDSSGPCVKAIFLKENHT